MHIKPLEYRVHMALLASIGLAGLFSTVRLNNTITARNDQREHQAAHQAQIKAIEDRADIAQAAIDNNVQQYDSVTISWYVCDPDNPPVFDTAPYIDDGRLEVSDRNDRNIGTLRRGKFTFDPENCTL